MMTYLRTVNRHTYPVGPDCSFNGANIFSFSACLCVLAMWKASFHQGGRYRVFKRSKRVRSWRFLGMSVRSGLWRLCLFVFTATQKVTVQDSSSWQLKNTTGALKHLDDWPKESVLVLYSSWCRTAGQSRKPGLHQHNIHHPTACLYLL